MTETDEIARPPVLCLCAPPRVHGGAGGQHWEGMGSKLRQSVTVQRGGSGTHARTYRARYAGRSRPRSALPVTLDVMARPTLDALGATKKEDL